jgi:catechol 2,3-dioxygenase-like lactoylglutathione lyase family enzyme
MFEIWGVRYQVKDVERPIKFYTEHLGFKLVHQAGSMFASVSMSGLNVFLSRSWQFPVPGRCPMDVNRNRADGIESSSESRIWRRW